MSGINIVRSGLTGVRGNLDTQTLSVINNAASKQSQMNQIAQRAEQITLQNMQEQLSAQNWAAGIKTEKDLLSQGLSLAKA
ncbi:MAG: hypothetical protein LW817_00620 [Candidatus Caenarcaniphilales bacterium]|jgi:hypothetical protein|nr:hypothetical protein [Candidatus Caenarcaniphilales bacterium]